MKSAMRVGHDSPSLVLPDRQGPVGVLLDLLVRVWLCSQRSPGSWILGVTVVARSDSRSERCNVVVHELDCVGADGASRMVAVDWTCSRNMGLE